MSDQSSLIALKQAFQGQTTIPSATAERLIEILERASEETLRLLAAEEIPFCSVGARLELMTRRERLQNPRGGAGC